MEQKSFLDNYQTLLNPETKPLGINRVITKAPGDDLERNKNYKLISLVKRCYDTNWTGVSHPASRSLMLRLQCFGDPPANNFKLNSSPVVSAPSHRVELQGVSPEGGLDDGFTIAYAEYKKGGYEVYFYRDEDTFAAINPNDDGELRLFQEIVEQILEQFPREPYVKSTDLDADMYFRGYS